jgi:hypothetical protein
VSKGYQCPSLPLYNVWISSLGIAKAPAVARKKIPFGNFQQSTGDRGWAERDNHSALPGNYY